MKKTVFALLTTVLITAASAYGSHITSDASLTLGNPATGTTTGNQQFNPIIWSKYGWDTLWQLNPNPWGVNSSAKGGITMEYNGTGSIVTSVDLSGLTVAGVNAYPFVFFGHDPFGYHMNGQPLTFPVQLSSLKSLQVDVNYALSIPGKAPGNLNVAFDEWLIPYPTYTAGFSGTLEVMVAPYFNFQWGTAGTLIGTITVPVTVNGTTTSMVFNEYSTGRGTGHEIIFYPRDTQISSGDVGLNLLTFMNAGAATAGLNSSWYLAGIEFGSEFGYTTAAKYTLTTKKIEIEEQFVDGH